MSADDAEATELHETAYDRLRDRIDESNGPVSYDAWVRYGIITTLLKENRELTDQLSESKDWETEYIWSENSREQLQAELNQWREVGDQLRDIDYLKDYDVFSKIEALLAKGEQG